MQLSPSPQMTRRMVEVVVEVVVVGSVRGEG
jgi:hypothetical protein